MSDDPAEEIEALEGREAAAAKDIAPDRKAAIAVMALGSETAREIFRVLEPDEIERLLAHAETLGDVSAPEVAAVLEELTADVDRQVSGVTGHETMLHDAAADALGRDNLSAILGRDSGGATDQLQRAAGADPATFAQTLSREHPQVVAVVLASLEPETGGHVLGSLPPLLKGEVVRRVANLRAVPAHMLAEVAEIVGQELRPEDEAGPVRIDGVQSAVDLLKEVEFSEEEAIFDDLRARDAELAEELRSLMFVFEDVRRLHDREVQLILREVDGQQLALALKGASNALKEYVLSNMSSRAGMIVLDDMEAMGPVSKAQVQEAQQEMVQVVMRLAEEGKVNIRPGETL
ncbi:MAG: flagellar motor switch protein FliG [Myxococcota bacterium]